MSNLLEEDVSFTVLSSAEDDEISTNHHAKDKKSTNTPFRKSGVNKTPIKLPGNVFEGQNLNKLISELDMSRNARTLNQL